VNIYTIVIVYKRASLIEAILAESIQCRRLRMLMDNRVSGSDH